MISKSLKVLCLFIFFLCALSPVRAQYKTWAQVNTRLIPFRKGDKWGFCDRKRKMAIPVVYDRVYPFGVPRNQDVGREETVSKDEAYGHIGDSCFFVGENGSRRFVGLLSKPSSVNRPSSGPTDMGYRVAILSDDHVLNEPRVVLDGQTFDAVDTICKLPGGNYYNVTVNSLHGVFHKGKMIVPMKYDYFHTWRDGANTVLVAYRDDKPELLNLQGRLLNTATYSEMEVEGKTVAIFGLVSVKKDGKWGFLNLKGKVVTACKYDKFYGFGANGLCLVAIGGKLGYIDCAGTEYFED